MDMTLEGRRAVVCGSTRGIGRACAFELAALGAEVTLLARDKAALEATAKELGGAAAGRHGFAAADFSDPDNVKRAIEGVVRERGGAHILINNTGGPPGGPALDATAEAYLDAFRAHLLCNQALVQALVPGMKEAKYGRIINIISTSVKEPIMGLGVSNTIRGAVAQWAKTLSMELGPFGITVNNVLPGATATDRLDAIFKARSQKSGRSEEQEAEAMRNTIPARRFAKPEETAAAAAFLASPAAGYINGINLPVDGGRTGCL